MVAPTSAPIAKLGHVAIETTDLEESLWFFRDLIGLNVVEVVDDTAYLRAARDWEHHTLSITETGSQGVNHVAFRASSEEALEELAADLEGQGIDVEWKEAGTERGVGRLFRFVSPHDHHFEVYRDVERPEAPEDRRSKLKLRRYDPTDANLVNPQRLDHTHVQGPEGREQTDWIMDTFGMGLNEIFTKGDGKEWAWWLSSTPLPHDIAVHDDPDLPESEFHHLAYHLNHLEDLWNAADILSENGITVDAGPGRHAITYMDYLYVIEPASGVRLELVRGPGYLNFESDWEPVVWEESEIGPADEHQWIGDQYSNYSSPYTGPFP
ncbi:VOC family protein [Halobellus marinus]|uniref:VOC family protein n=1 Tax=Halobellus TaxID=1073986 RepID=UPI0028B023F6|nr:VOC family protein [Halobellus sp. DFY28]